MISNGRAFQVLFLRVLGIQPQTLRVTIFTFAPFYVTPRCLDLFQKPPSFEGFPIG